MEYQVQSPTGEMHVIDGPEGASDEEITSAAQNLFGQGALESFGRGAVNNLPAGGQIGALGTSALKGIDYSQGMEEFNQKAQEAKAEHPIAYGAGAVTGAVAPLAIPGVGEAMTAAPAASGAVLGALNAVGNTDVTKQPEEALKQAGEGAAIGGVLGGILPTGKQAARELENFANSKAVQTLGLKPGMLGIPSHELEDLGSFASEAGLTQGSLEQRVNTAKNLLDKTGTQIGDIGAGARPLSDPSEFVDTLHKHLQESASIFGPEANPEATVYRQAIANISKPNITFDELQNLKTAYGQRAFDGMGNVKNDAAANVYNTIKDSMKSIINESPADYQEAMTAYSKLKDIHSGLMNQFQQAQAGGIQAKGFGLAGKLTGMVSGGHPGINVTAAAALGPAHPFMALGAMTPLVTNPQAMESAVRGVAGAIPKAAQAVTAGSIDAMVSGFLQNPSAYGKFRAPLSQAMQSGGSQGFAAASFVLRQQHPELNDIMMGKQEATANEGE